MAFYLITTTWTMEGHVTVEADSLEAALGEADLLTSDYMDETEEIVDSFEVMEVEEIR